MIHFVYRAPRYNSIIGKIFEKISFKIGTPKGFPVLWRKGNHLPWRQPVRAPHSITYNLLNRFKKEYEVNFYDLYEKTICNLSDGDIFIGVPIQTFDGKKWDDPEISRVTANTLERFKDNNKIRKFIIMPYNHDHKYNTTTTEIIKRYGSNLIIVSGKYWTDTWDKSPIKKYVKNLLRVNMGINPDQYPVVKRRFNEKGKRKYLYIGHTGYYKNTRQLELIAEKIPNFQGGHIGLGEIKGWKKISDFADLTPEFMTKIAEEYDIFLNTSIADASPTTILEQMCFGFMVACTPESSYDYDSITKLHIDDTEYNVNALNELQYADETELIKRAGINREYTVKFHNWENICNKITDFITRDLNDNDRLFLVD